MRFAICTQSLLEYIIFYAFLGLNFTSDKARLWEQCDGKEYNVRRICENDTKCFARDISYWQVSFSVENALSEHSRKRFLILVSA